MLEVTGTNIQSNHRARYVPYLIKVVDQEHCIIRPSVIPTIRLHGWLLADTYNNKKDSL